MIMVAKNIAKSRPKSHVFRGITASRITADTAPGGGAWELYDRPPVEIKFIFVVVL